jgi:ferredoxin-like protein FixX
MKIPIKFELYTSKMYLEIKEYTNTFNRKINPSHQKGHCHRSLELPNNRLATLCPGATFARRKEAERDRHAQLKEKTSLARDSHAPVTGNPHGRSNQQRN